jgi:hypothetical protein
LRMSRKSTRRLSAMVPPSSGVAPDDGGLN